MRTHGEKVPGTTLVGRASQGQAQAQLAFKTANAASPEDWCKSGDEWTRLREEVGLEKEDV